jgi:hypothetical protein
MSVWLANNLKQSPASCGVFLFGEIMRKRQNGVVDVDYTPLTWKKVTNEDGSHRKVIDWICPAFSVWRDMLARCYGKRNKKNSTYIECSVISEWLSLKTFKMWFDINYVEGWELDKDILVGDNSIYSPPTCVFVPSWLNRAFPKNNPSASLPMGVGYKKKPAGMINELTKPFAAKIFSQGKQKYLGNYKTPEEAHRAWQQAKVAEICRVADMYEAHPSSRGDVIQAIRKRAEVIQKDLAEDKRTYHY